MPSTMIRRTVAALFLASLAAASPHAQVNDAWSSVVTLRGPGEENFLAPIHATLLPNGKVMLIGFKQTVESPANGSFRTGSFTALLDAGALTAQLPGSLPTTVQLPVYAEPVDWAKPNTLEGHCVEDTLFCSGHALLDDGNLFVAGGLRTTAVNTTSVSIVGESGGGLPYAAVWDWNATQPGWTRVNQDMVGIGAAPGAVPHQSLFVGNERYYPTVTRLGGKKALITGGTQVLGMTYNHNGNVTTILNSLNLSVELFTPGAGPAAGTFSLVSSHAQSPPAIFNRDYSHTFLLPNKVGGRNVLILGESAEPVLLDTTSGSWSTPAMQRPALVPPAAGTAPNHGASSLMLPIWRTDGQFGYANGSVLSLGGDAPFLDEVDVWDPVSATWSQKPSIPVVRHHPSTVLLPDGTVLVCCGHGPSGTPAVQQGADYIDVSDTNFPVVSGTGTASTIRGYHTVTLLLPCGNVLVGGGRGGGTLSSPIERANVEFLSPPYVQNPNRPTLESAPNVIDKGREFDVTVSGQAPADAVLIALGSMTHSFDQNQRMIQLETVSVASNGGTWTLRLRAPNRFSVAPRGYYMLFVRDANRTPSKAKILRLRPAKVQVVDPPQPHP